MKILFFAPHSAIWVHAFPEALVAESLQAAGHEVVYVTCGEALQAQCVAMSPYGVGFRHSEAERRGICAQCGANKAILRRRMNLKGYDLSEVLRPDDHRSIDEILSRLDRDDYLGLDFEGVPVGRYALYELLLHHKKMATTLDDAQWQEYRAIARGALVAAFAARAILEREKPDRVLTYNSLYSVNRVFSRLAEARGIPTYFMHAGGNLSRRLQTLMLGRDHALAYLKNLIAEWPRFRDLPCPPALVEQITAHFLVLFAGTSVFGYSSAVREKSVDIRARFGIRDGQKLLVATLSSPDERFAAETVGALPADRASVFATQADWIRALIDYTASRPDLFLLVRVHPREFPNKRESVRSENASRLVKLFEALPPNAAVNWPWDDIAMYQLANHADVFLNAWSSAGKEMALLGLPVVVYSPELLFYPADLNYVAKTRDDFFAKIELALEEGWSLERSRRVYRWLAVEYGYGLIDIGDGYRQKEQARMGYAGRVIHRIRSRIDRHYVQERDCRGRARPLGQAGELERIVRLGAYTPLDPELDRTWPPRCDPQAEERALRGALARLGAALFGASPSRHRGRLARELAAIAEAKAA